ncbi:MAG: MMPL family transporter [Bifidobacteriaceae bacterium]|jgi:RND superfamily putative drug exporter|nr:MMPL family transporter [Bifidobacteriaceae bacterium]
MSLLTKDPPRVAAPVPPAGAARRSLPRRISSWSARHRGWAIAAWLVFVFAASSITGVMAPKQASTTDQIRGEAKTATEVAEAAGAQDPVVESILATAPDGGPVDAARAQEALGEIAAAMAALPEVAVVSPQPVPAPDGEAVLLSVQMAGAPAESVDHVQPLLDATAAVAADYPDLKIEEVGVGSIAAETNEWLGTDLNRATVTSVPVTLIILLLAFGAIVMAGLPVLLALGSVASAFGLWAVASQAFPDQGMVQHVIVLMGMAVGVDYSLFYLRRFREEIHSGKGRMDAIEAAGATAGHSVLISGSAVTVAMATTLALNDTFFAGMGVGAILVVLVAMASSVTALPAMVSALARFVDRPRVPLIWRFTTGDKPKVMPALVTPVVRHPAIAATASLVLLVLLAIPATGMQLKLSGTEDLPRSLDTMKSFDRLLEHFPGNAAANRIVLRSSEPIDAEAQSAELGAAFAARSDLYGQITSVWNSEDGRVLVVDVEVPHASESAEGKDSVRLLREEILPQTTEDLPAAEAYVGGMIAMNLDYTSHLRSLLPPLIGFVIAVTFLFMFVTYRSAVIALATVVLNLLSALAAFGALTAVFQGKWAQGLLGFTSNGTLASWIPPLLFVILVGLSLDYHVFVISRIQENARAGMEAREAIRTGVIRTAGVVTSAAAVMVGVFAIFGVLSFIELKEIGVGLAVAVILDATVIRIIALPSVLVLARRFLWWPGVRGARPAGPERVALPVAVAPPSAPIGLAMEDDAALAARVPISPSPYPPEVALPPPPPPPPAAGPPPLPPVEALASPVEAPASPVEAPPAGLAPPAAEPGPVQPSLAPPPPPPPPPWADAEAPAPSPAAEAAPSPRRRQLFAETLVDITGLAVAVPGSGTAQDIALRVNAGQVVALLGPAAQAVAAVLAGRATPLRGAASGAGWRGALAEVPGAVSARADLPVRDAIAFALKQAGHADALARAEQLVRWFALSDWSGVPAARLTGADRVLFALALGLGAGPEAALLRSPCAGLDAGRRAVVEQAIGHLAAEGRGYVLVTDSLEEAESLASDVVVAGGPANGTRQPVADFIRDYGPPARIAITVRSISGLDQALSLFRRMELDSVSADAEGHLALAAVAGGPEDLARVIYRLKAAGIEPAGITLAAPSLREAFAAAAEPGGER